MCTVGAILDNRRVLTFKQCDLPSMARFFEPVRRRGRGNLRYIAFKRRGASGPWAGVNNHGVAFVAADAYLDAPTEAQLGPLGNVFEGYAKIVSEHASAPSAVDYMLDFYEDHGAPDILLVSDSNGAFLIEYSPVDGARVAHHEMGALSATNHFQMLPGGVERSVNQSTYTRLERAEELLDRNPSLEGIHAVLTDQAYGETALSICRVAEEPGQYYTQAAVIFHLEDDRVDCSYLLNGNPRTKPFASWENIFGVK